MQRLFRLGKALVISVLAAQDLQPLADALSVVRAQPIAQKRVDRQVEKVRELHQHRDLRKALPLLLLAHRRNGDAHRLGQLLLRQALLPAVKADLICHRIFHTLLLSRPA